jgi:hypothetical protein
VRRFVVGLVAVFIGGLWAAIPGVGAANPSGATGAAGSGWSLMSGPPQVTGQMVNWNSLSCVSSTFCMAVGPTPPAETPPLPIESDIWDGSSWSTVTLPVPSSTAVPTSVSCLTDSFCMAVGYGGSTTISFADEWTGSSWTALPVEAPAGSMNSALTSVSCLSPTDCEAVGIQQPNTTLGDTPIATVAEEWNGSAWSLVPSENTGSEEGSFLNSVSCVSPTNCLAVGTAGSPLAEQWDGSAWSIVSTSGLPIGSILSAISCTAASMCVAVGVDQNSETAVIATWSGSAWTDTTSPITPTAGKSSDLGGVDCSSSTSCMAVGVNGSSSLVLGFSGGTWSTVTPPNTDSLGAVACVASWACVAASPETGSSGGTTSYFEEATPTTSVVLPANNTTLSGSEYLDSTASPGVTAVSYELSGNGLSDDVVAAATATLYGWLAQWNTEGVASGTYTLQSVASTAGGVSGISPAITVTVDNPTLTTSVVLPANNTTVSGMTQYLDATASSRVTGVSYELSGNGLNDDVVATGTASFYGWLAAWNTTVVPNGTYTLNSVATAPGAPNGTSAGISVTVNNPAPTTTVVLPANNATLLVATQYLDATASSGVTSVIYEVSGGPTDLSDVQVATGTNTLYGWLGVWNTTTVPDGTYTLTSVASYAGGVSGTSAGITVTINN